MKQRQRTSISLEAIRHQTDKKAYKELVGYFGMLRNSAGDPVDTYFSLVEKQLLKTLRLHYGISATSHVVKDGANDYTLAVGLPAFTEKHPLVQGKFSNVVSGKANAGTVKELLTAPDNILGFGVDYETGRLTGFATQLEVPLYIGESILRDGEITAEMLATGVLHEIGHVITYFLSLRYSTSTSWAIRYAIEVLDGTDGDESFLISMNKLGNLPTPQDVERKSVLDDKAKKDRVTLIILDQARQITRSALGTCFADQSSMEALADQFVVRHGDAVEYAKLIEFFSRRERPVMNKTEMVIAGAMCAVATMVLGPITTLASFAVSFSIGMFIHGSMVAGTPYDKAYERTVRLRNDMVAVLKSSDQVDVRNHMLLDIKALDRILPMIKANEPMINKALPFFSSNLRNLRREKSLVQAVESLFNNPLYVREAQLAQISEL